MIVEYKTSDGATTVYRVATNYSHDTLMTLCRRDLQKQAILSQELVAWAVKNNYYVAE